jgi:hypothetical protein
VAAAHPGISAALNAGLRRGVAQSSIRGGAKDDAVEVVCKHPLFYSLGIHSDFFPKKDSIYIVRITAAPRKQREFKFQIWKGHKLKSTQKGELAINFIHGLILNWKDWDGIQNITTDSIL